ncbi:MAG TPA: hypothetical protein VMN35_05140 [Gaiellaceae bacterium]|nr:hypothetical protein [Gaiellaceae bacterium]
MRRLSIALVCFVFLLVGAGCGGGDEEAGSDTETIVTTETATDETTTLDVDTSGLEGFASEECLELVSAGAAISQAFTAATTGGDLDEASELFDRLVDKAPSEIRADLATIAGFFTEYAEVLRDLDLESGQTPSAEDLQKIQAAFASIDQPELTAASERISTWAAANCPSS